MENRAVRRKITGNFIQQDLVKHIPKELINRCLARLPVKSLLRFRCLSRSLCSLIDSKQFVYLHLNTYSQISHLKIVFQEGEEDDMLLKTNYNNAKLHLSDLELGLGDLDRNPEKGLHIYGYCNGILLLLVKSQLVLWNPSRQQQSILPLSPFDIGSGLGMECAFGFGYDSSNDDYKVVVIGSDPEDLLVSQVWIFGLKSNLWRKVSAVSLPNDIKISGHGYRAYFADDHLNWFLRTKGKRLFEFDMAKETFSEVDQPVYPSTRPDDDFIDLDILDGRLSISFCSKDKTVLYVRGKNGTWSILFSITEAQLPLFLKISDFKSVLKYSKEKDNKIMLYIFGFDYVVSYDLKEKTFGRTTIITSLGDTNQYESDLLPCAESLCLPKSN